MGGGGLFFLRVHQTYYKRPKRYQSINHLSNKHLTWIEVMNAHKKPSTKWIKYFMLCNHNHLTWLIWHRVQPSNAELSMCTHVIQFLMMVFLDAVEFIRHSSDSTPQSLATYIPDRFFNEPLAFGIDFPRFALIGADIYLITHTHTHYVVCQ